MVNSYEHRNSIVHNTPFFIKLLLFLVLITGIYLYNNLYISSAGLLLCVALYSIAKLSLLYLWRILKMLIPIFVAIFLYHIIVTTWQNAVITASKVLISIAYANLLSLTTPLTTIFNKGTRVYKLLVFCRISPPRIQLAIHIVLRTVPLLFTELSELKTSMRLRGRSKSTIKLVFPLLLRTVSQSDQLVDALTLRGYEEIL